MAIKKMKESVPVISTEELEIEENEIVLSDKPFLKPGTYYGRCAYTHPFIARNGERFQKMGFGVVQQLDGEKKVVEIDRVFYAEYYMESEFVKTLQKLDVVSGHKAFPERVLNKAVKLTVTYDEEAKDTRFKNRIEEIEAVDDLPEDVDFMYHKILVGGGYEYRPLFHGDEPEVMQNDISKMEAPNEIKFDFDDDSSGDDFLGDL